MSDFVAKAPYEAAHPPALAIYCSDGRFTTAVEELLQSLGHKRLDTMTLPGGPGLLNHLSASYAEADVATKAATFLIKGHGIASVVLLAHANCGYYRAKRTMDSPEQIRARQIDDLRVGARALRRVKPDLDVHLYYAQPNPKRVVFVSITH